MMKFTFEGNAPVDGLNSWSNCVQIQAMAFRVWNHVKVLETISDHAFVAKEHDVVEVILEDESSVDDANSKSHYKES